MLLAVAALASLTACQPQPALTPPANGTYYPGQTLTFIITFATAVTVTGSPRIELTARGAGDIGTGNKAFAAYTSGSGTSALTFFYTVRAGDNAQGGIIVAPTIDLGDGTISPPARSFARPDLSRVVIAPFPWPAGFR